MTKIVFPTYCIFARPITVDLCCGMRPVAAGSHEVELNKVRNRESVIEMKGSECLSIQCK